MTWAKILYTKNKLYSFIEEENKEINFSESKFQSNMKAANISTALKALGEILFSLVRFRKTPCYNDIILNGKDTEKKRKEKNPW